MCDFHSRFWIVMADRQILQATVRHTSREDAKAEALRLAAANPGHKFYVAAVTGVAQTNSANWTELKNDA